MSGTPSPRHSADPQAGQPARKLGNGWEVIGPRECPLMFRKTILAHRLGKVLVHRFVPDATDEAAHDHPRSFVTVVLRGGYDDLVPCATCLHSESPGWLLGPPSEDWKHAQPMTLCPACLGHGRIGERLRAPAVRYRRAEHAHVTRVHEDGALTLVVMGRLRRPWGFWQRGKWFEWRDFERKFGLNWRCP